jgi:hypothetical protein
MKCLSISFFLNPSGTCQGITKEMKM